MPTGGQPAAEHNPAGPAPAQGGRLGGAAANKEDDELKRIPIVVLTTSGAESDMVNAYTRGAGSYLVKPVDFDKFTKLMDTFGYYWLAWNKFPE